MTRENFSRFPYEQHFCTCFWDVIKIKIYSTLQGGNMYWKGWMKDSNQLLLSCDDGARPVTLLLEIVEDPEEVKDPD